MRRMLLAVVLLFGCVQNWKPESGNPPVNSTLEIYFLNVSQGDSEFLRNGNHTMLIDCGQASQSDKIAEYLTQLGAYKIDYLVMTHTDSDHIGGCAEVLRKFFVKSVIVDGQERETYTYNRTMGEIDRETIIIAQKGQRFALGQAELEVVHANTGSDEPNQNSIVMMVRFGNFTLLLDADCDGECELDLLSENIDADVLKVAHHGSKYASSTEFLQKVSPLIAVIEVGKNDYGHPDSGTLARLRAAGAEVLRTDANGTIVLRTEGNGYSVAGQN